MFFYLRKSSNGVTMPTWLRPGPVYVKRHVRSKDDLFVHDVELVETDPQYAHVRLNNCRKTTVSLRDLAPLPQHVNCDCSDPTKTSIESTEIRDCARSEFLPSISKEPLSSEAKNTSPDESQPPLHRFMRLQPPVIRCAL